MNQHKFDTITLELSVNEIAVLGCYFQTHKDTIKSEAREHVDIVQRSHKYNPVRAASFELANTDVIDEFINLWLYHDTKKPF